MNQNQNNRELKDIIKNMKTTISNLTLGLVINSLTLKEVILFDTNTEEDQIILQKLKQIGEQAKYSFNQSAKNKNIRVNEVGHALKEYIREISQSVEDIKVSSPLNEKGKGQHSGYPDFELQYKDKIYYLECKTFNKNEKKQTLRSFYLSPSNSMKITKDAVHLLISFCMNSDSDIYRIESFEILSICNLSLKVKYEFNASNKSIYSDHGGAVSLYKSDI